MSPAEERNVAYAGVFGFIVALGLPLNAASLWILVRRHRFKSPSAVFMINLAAADLLLVLSLPMRVYFYATGTWSFGVQACIWMTMLFRNNIRASAVFITCIGVDRLLAVVFPLRSRHLRTTTNSWRACVLVWVSLVALNVPESYQRSKLMYGNNETTCFVFRHWHSKTPLYLQSYLVLALLGVNVVATSMVAWKLRGLSASGQVTDNKVNVMLMFVVNLLMFVIFFLPVSLTLIVAGHVAVPPTSVRLTVCLASLNCCFDPLLYYFSLDSFWKKKDNLSSSSLK